MISFNISIRWLIGLSCVALPLPSMAATHYVSQLSSNPVSPYTSWSTAATDIQSAIDAAVDGDVIHVTNGTYETGGRAVYSNLMNRVAMTIPITVQSVNGPDVTIIKGVSVLGDTAVRCAYVTVGGTLIGFTLTNGGTRIAGDYLMGQSGGGVFCESGGLLSNCVLAGNSAAHDGGGAEGGTLNNCILTGNSAAHFGGGAHSSILNNCTLTGNSSASYGGGSSMSTLKNCVLMGNCATITAGGAHYGTLNNCTLTGNSAFDGGGAEGAILNNSILWQNIATIGSNYSGGALAYCCSVPLAGGSGNIAVDPQLASASHLSGGSPCIGKGSSAFASGVDVDGELWVNPPSMGCDESHADAITGNLSVSVSTFYTQIAPGYNLSLSSDIRGRTTGSRWSFGDGVVISNQVYVSHSWTMTGTYPVVLTAFNASNPTGVSGTVMVSVVSRPVYYVATGNTSAFAPYSSWSTAASSIQDAIDIAVPWSLILVTNGTYEGGLEITQALTVVQSVNGPGVTIIDGRSYVRGAYLINGASLVGFTITNGYAGNGGGCWCGPGVILSNCTLTECSASQYGGGAYGGTLNNCLLMGNYSASYGGGSSLSVLNNCILTGNTAVATAGGAHYGTLNNCTLTGNSASIGGGAESAALNNCILTGNSAATDGGGASKGVLINCTLTGNSCVGNGGGAEGATLKNCIIWQNVANIGSNYYGGALTNCCTTPLASGAGNIAVDPQLASASHLSGGSPCIGQGSGAFVSGSDIDGEPWANSPSMGCDEYHAGSISGALSVVISAVYTHVSPGFKLSFGAGIGGRTTGSRWSFGDGVVSTNQVYVSHAWDTTGSYPVVLTAFNESYPAGVSATVMVSVVVPSVYYVAAGNTSAVAPYSSWSTAASNIQDAIDAVTIVGSLILVTNGTYERVMIAKPILVQGVSGPDVTIINGDGGRCAYVTNGASLLGFTLTNGYAYYGGGVLCEAEGFVSNCTLNGNSAEAGGGSYGGILNNCILTGNYAYAGGGAYGGTLNGCTLTENSVYGLNDGGGAYGSTLNNCTLTENYAGYGAGAFNSTLNNCTLTENSAGLGGGGAYGGTLNNCTLTGNSAGNYGGGAEGAALNNCIIWQNSAWEGSNYSGGELSYCCTTPLAIGSGNIADDPQLVNSSHVWGGSPCIGHGSSLFTSGVDIDGELWVNPPSIGCDEYHAGSITVGISTPYMQVVPGYNLKLDAVIEGGITGFLWSFGDGVVESNQMYVSHSWATTGSYPVVLTVFNESYPSGVSSTVIVSVLAPPVHYVVDGNASAVPPYSSWITAASSIQDAIDAVIIPGSLVLVTNGTYESVTISNLITVQSVNGPTMTVINGHGNARCAYITDGASLVGFTLTNGAADSGGGVWCGSGVVVSNCKLTECSAYVGGGAYGGTLNNCTLTGNEALNVLEDWEVDPIDGFGGGADSATLNNCTLTGNTSANYGGGSSGGALNNCTLTGNFAADHGGGSYYSTLNGCILTGNNADNGGGAFGGTLSNCTLTGNSATEDGGGAHGALLYNSTLTGNETLDDGGGVSGSALDNCTLTANLAGDHGGGANASTLSDCLLTGNVATNDGGGANGGTLDRCTLTGNEALDDGGGANGGTLNNCILTENVADDHGGGTHDATLNNCTLTENSANSGGGVSDSSCINCIVWSNHSPANPNWRQGAYQYTDTAPLAPGVGNLTNYPSFISLTNFYLNPNSPCIDTGVDVTDLVTDLDGIPRPLDGNNDGIAAWDIGCYEYVNGISDTDQDGLSDSNEVSLGTSLIVSDTDGDGMADGGELVADTDPLDGTSALTLTAVRQQGGSLSLDWKGGVNVWQYLECNETLNPTGWVTLLGIPPPTPRTNAIIDLTTTNRLRYYRLRVGP